MQSLQERPLSMQQKVFEMLFEAAKVSKMSEVEYNKYLSVMTTERDVRNQIAYARKEGLEMGRAAGREEGRKEGIEEGRAEGKSGVIKDLILSNIKIMGADKVASFMGMSKEEVIRIAEGD